MQDKYKMFLNFMYNELQISKDDIKNWLQEACQEIAVKMVANEYDKFSVEKVVNNCIIENRNLFSGTYLKKEIMSEIASQLIKTLKLEIKIPEIEKLQNSKFENNLKYL